MARLPSSELESSVARIGCCMIVSSVLARLGHQHRLAHVAGGVTVNERFIRSRVRRCWPLIMFVEGERVADTATAAMTAVVAGSYTRLGVRGKCAHLSQSVSRSRLRTRMGSCR